MKKEGESVLFDFVKRGRLRDAKIMRFVSSFRVYKERVEIPLAELKGEPAFNTLIDSTCVCH